MSHLQKTVPDNLTFYEIEKFKIALNEERHNLGVCHVSGNTIVRSLNDRGHLYVEIPGQVLFIIENADISEAQHLKKGDFFYINGKPSGIDISQWTIPNATIRFRMDVPTQKNFIEKILSFFN